MIARSWPRLTGFDDSGGNRLRQRDLRWLERDVHIVGGQVESQPPGLRVQLDKDAIVVLEIGDPAAAEPHTGGGMSSSATGGGAGEAPSAATAKVDTKTVANQLRNSLRMKFSYSLAATQLNFRIVRGAFTHIRTGLAGTGPIPSDH